MKKVLSILIASVAMAALFALVGCGGGASSNYKTHEGDGFTVEYPAVFETASDVVNEDQSSEGLYTATIDGKEATVFITAIKKDMLVGGTDQDSTSMMISYYTEMSGASMGDFVRGSVDGQPSVSANTVSAFDGGSQVGSLVAVELKSGDLLFVSVYQEGEEFTEGISDYAQHLQDHVSLS